jgi:hypothetical protein
MNFSKQNKQIYKSELSTKEKATNIVLCILFLLVLILSPLLETIL